MYTHTWELGVRAMAAQAAESEDVRRGEESNLNGREGWEGETRGEAVGKKFEMLRARRIGLSNET